MIHPGSSLVWLKMVSIRQTCRIVDLLYLPWDTLLGLKRGPPPKPAPSALIGQAERPDDEHQQPGRPASRWLSGLRGLRDPRGLCRGRIGARLEGVGRRLR